MAATIRGSTDDGDRLAWAAGLAALERAMMRNGLSVIAGLIAWALVATLLDRCLRAALPGYAAAEPILAFSLTMKVARLGIAVTASLIAGAVIRAVAPASRWMPWIVGLILLVVFLPIHIHIGSRLPLWYHLFFLLTLAPLVALGARMRIAANVQQ